MHQPGDIIKERYQILNLLGQGGIASTYAAEDLNLSQQVAIKILSLRQLKDWKALELFEREGKVLAQLNHPGIPNYLDYFQLDIEGDRRFYIVQEIAPGQSLQNWVESGWRPTELEVREIAKQLLEILAYLHQLTPPVVHRDIKPQNIIRQSNNQVFLVDFGAVQDTYRHTMTSGSTIVGTYGYMAPEQFRGQAKPATDLYGLGATLLFLLTHKDPADFPEKRMKIDFRPYVNITPELADWLENLLEPVIEDRLTSATEALALLQGKRERIVPRSPGNLQPVGSRVVLEKTPRQLKVKVPLPNVQFHSIFRLVFSIVWLISLISITRVFSGNFLTLLFLVPFWLLGIASLVTSLRNMLVYNTLNFYSDKFEISWFFLGTKRTIQGNIDDISKVVVSPVKGINSEDKVMNCALEVGTNSYCFGSGLTATEREWLVTEIAEFIGKPKLIDN
ncbi:serine/threonine protein kinase [Phormidium pseudopriestleyi FRX01]|uniref:non-specific serine/threonine protein kinase n=1 Tax=Phormidium pseudopriestleyi FRX01 TaxID=1759528 RepID=A0ABS3FVL0_9CYAN|nr:serine/threonine-protein kinase [Phormidium pseudopriestleyi]MBO0351169.1 serine/threonine protein kinase [Phormidium pseudopriestleyi FRX01]